MGLVEKKNISFRKVDFGNLRLRWPPCLSKIWSARPNFFVTITQRDAASLSSLEGLHSTKDIRMTDLFVISSTASVS